ncbi:MAG TPA: ATP-binding protein, partial [Anaerolineales bacterium]|nr:ATP-binding protein [Anaerolineales bacterium]
TRLEISSLSFTVTTWFMAWSLLRFRLADILQVARGRLIESMSDPLVVLDGDGQVVYVNTAAQQLIGHTPLEAVGLPVEEIWAEWPGWMENVETGIETTREVALGLGDEKTFYDMRVSPLLDWRKRLVGMVVVLRDISDRMRAEEELRHYATELEHSNQELEQFAYVASHDLQEPLRMVAGYTQLLSRRYQGKLDADADEFIAFAVDGATRMQRLINDLLEFSRVGTRGKPPEVTDCEVVFERAVLNLKLAIEERHARVTHDPLPTLMADGSQLIQLLQNLIGNAVKFHGGRLPEVHIGASRENGAWLFRVRDNGIGIDPKYFERIFLIFQRLHNRTDYAGTGIGLAVCRKIVERHGGSIWVESEPGKGATFFFTIPIDGENET